MSITLKSRPVPLHTAWSLEDRLLFGFVRACGPDGEPGAAAYPAGPLSWDRIVDQAIEGGVAPLVYMGLREADQLARVPVSAAERLRNAYFMIGAENIRYLACAGRVLSTCRESDIDVIPLRGIAFVESLYRNIALRPLSDVDLLVRPSAFQRLRVLLDSLRYWPVAGHPNQWTNADIVLDIHVDLAGVERIAARGRAAQIDMEMVWDAAVPAVIAGVETRTLSWTDTVLVCCLHAIKHSCDRLVWFADLAALLTCQTIDWDSVISRARWFHLTKPVYYALAYLQATIGTPLPAGMMDELRPARTGWMERRCMERVLRGEPAGRFGEVFSLFMMERIRDRLAFIVETCFPHRAVIEQAYGVRAMNRFPSRPRRLLHVAGMVLDVIRGYPSTASGSGERGASV